MEAKGNALTMSNITNTEINYAHPRSRKIAIERLDLQVSLLQQEKCIFSIHTKSEVQTSSITAYVTTKHQSATSQNV